MKPFIYLRTKVLQLQADREIMTALGDEDSFTGYNDHLSARHYHWYEPLSKGIEDYPTPNRFLPGLKPLHYHYPDIDVPQHPHNQRDHKVHRRIDFEVRRTLWGFLSPLPSFMPVKMELADIIDPIEEEQDPPVPVWAVSP